MNSSPRCQQPTTHSAVPAANDPPQRSTSPEALNRRLSHDELRCRRRLLARRLGALRRLALAGRPWRPGAYRPPTTAVTRALLASLDIALRANGGPPAWRSDPLRYNRRLPRFCGAARP